MVKTRQEIENVISRYRRALSALGITAEQVILFGSYAYGKPTEDSDIDLFIVAKDPEAAQKAINDFKSRRKIQPVIKTSLQLVQLGKKDKEFTNEINSGIVLWEEGDGS